MGNDYKISALRIEFPMVNNNPTPQNQMPMGVSMSTWVEGNNNWVPTNCVSDDIYAGLVEGINRDSFDIATGGMAWNFVCNNIDQTAKRVKLEITKRVSSDGFYFESIALVGG